jgi:type I restriction enzyme S subunit
MSKEKKLIPELRFPEFEKDGEWEISPLGNLSSPINEKTKGRKFTLMSITAGYGLVTQIEKFGREIAGKSYNNYYVLKKYDFAYNKSSTKLFPQGEIAILEDIEEGAVPNSIFTCFRFDTNKIFPLFAKYLFVNNIHGLWLRKYISVGARAHGALQVNNKDLFAVPISFTSLSEQQKIATCLSSLDELIAAHKDKLQALKDHKKGLMQNLFPSSESGFTRLKDEQDTSTTKILKSNNPQNPDSDNVPRLRFPEFVKDGEWVEKAFEELFEIGSGKDYKHLEKGDVPVYGSGGYMISVNDYLYDGESVCIGRKGTIDNPLFLTGKFWTVDTLFYTYEFNNCLPKFIYYVFLGINWQNHNEAGGVPSLSKKNLYKIRTALPATIQEQQKIASCLSSLDELIRAESEKIEQLQQHKKGLMQGLFPKNV